MAEVIPGLWQEPIPNEYDWGRFDVVVSMIGMARSAPPAGKALVILNTDDSEIIPDIEDVAKMLARLVLQGKRVMVHCAAGYNRSGLLVALTLWHMGMQPLRAVEMIRKAVPDALCNEHFDKYIRSR